MTNSHYDYVIVGSGIFGAIAAYRAANAGKKVLVVEKRNHTGGNAATEMIEGIACHKYGAHIFHTDNKKVWDFVNGIAPFRNFVNSPLANYKGKLYNLPFNMNTFYAMWGVTKPEEARAIIERQRREAGITEPANLEEQAISLVGKDIFEKLIKGYTEKQWGRPCADLPAFIIKRLPVRFTFDNNYFGDAFQGIPLGGYETLFNKLLEGAEVKTGVDFFSDRKTLQNICETLVFSGKIDEFYDYRFGPLAYRSLRFETETLGCENFQGNAVVNYTDRETPFTRLIEHKHFENLGQKKTVITREYPAASGEPYYPVNDGANSALYEKYRALASAEKKTIFGGRLAEYRYCDMDKAAEKALEIDL
jgi:UDP-galactopyranose mutase